MIWGKDTVPEMYFLSTLCLCFRGCGRHIGHFWTPLGYSAVGKVPERRRILPEPHGITTGTQTGTGTGTYFSNLLRRLQTTASQLSIGSLNRHEVPPCPWIRVSDPHTDTEFIHALGSGMRTTPTLFSDSVALRGDVHILLARLRDWWLYPRAWLFWDEWGNVN